MKTLAFFLLMNSAHLLTGSAPPVPTSSSQIARPQCAQIHVNTTNEEMPFYSHSRIFGDSETSNDVQAFKFYCANHLITSLIEDISIEVNTKKLY